MAMTTRSSIKVKAEFRSRNRGTDVAAGSRDVLSLRASSDRAVQRTQGSAKLPKKVPLHQSTNPLSPLREVGPVDMHGSQCLAGSVKISRRIFPSAVGSFSPRSSAMVGATSILSTIPNFTPDFMPRPQATNTPFIFGLVER